MTAKFGKADIECNMSVDDLIKQHMKERSQLIEADKKHDFSYELEAMLTDDERRANEKLKLWREEVANDTYNATIHNFFKNKTFLESSNLHKALNIMPKGAIHHIHTTAAFGVEDYLKLTYDPIVYFSQHEHLFRVYPKH